MTETLYCDGPDPDGNPGECGLPVDRLGKCSTHRKQFQRTGKCQPIAVKLSAEERATNAWHAMLEAASGPDDEYQRLRRLAIGRLAHWQNQLRHSRLFGVTMPRIERLAIDAFLEMTEAVGDAEHKRRRRVFLRRLVEWSDQLHRAKIREALKRAAKRGVRIGRPVEVDPVEAAKAWRRLRSGSRVAKVLGVARSTAYLYRPR